MLHEKWVGTHDNARTAFACAKGKCHQCLGIDEREVEGFGNCGVSCGTTAKSREMIVKQISENPSIAAADAVILLVKRDAVINLTCNEGFSKNG